MSPWPGAIACVLALLACAAGVATLVQHIRARRAERQIRGAQYMRASFKAARRYGLLPEDLQ